ncbi:MAG: endospore germination permease [Clostridia bacterium]
MEQDKNLGSYGIVTLITTLIITKVFVSAPTLYVGHSKSAGWIEVLISGLFEIFLLFIVLRLMSNFGNMDIIDISEYSFGKTGKFIVGLTSSIVLIISSAAVFRSFEELVRNTVIKGISYESAGLFIFAGGLVGAYLGIRTQVQLNGLILPLVIISVLLTLGINFSRLFITNIQPFLGTGISDVVSNAILKNGSYFELGIILFLIPYMGNKNAVKKNSLTALLISVAVLSTITLLYQLAVPYEAAETFAIPLYQMTRMLKAGTFFQRIEPLNIFIWCGTMFLYVGIGISLTAQVLKKTFSLKDERPLVFVLALIIYSLALIPGSETNTEKIYDFIITYSYIAYPILPVLFLSLATLCKKTKE